MSGIKLVKKLLINLKISNKIILIYMFAITSVGTIFYPLIPQILNYPPGTVNTIFQVKYSGLVYTQQYIFVVAFGILIGYTSLKIYLKDLDDIYKVMVSNKAEDNEKLQKQIQKCIDAPYKIYIAQNIIFNICVLGILLLVNPFITVIRIWMVIFSFLTISSSIMYIYTKNIFTNILNRIYNKRKITKGHEKLIKRVFIQIMPLIITSMMFIFLVANLNYLKSQGEYLYKEYKQNLDTLIQKTKIENENDLIKVLEKVNYSNRATDTGFFISKNKEYTLNNSEISKFFKQYIYDLSDIYNGRVYDAYALSIQGYAKYININSEAYYYGIKYEIPYLGDYGLLLISIIILVTINSFALYYFAKSLAEDIQGVARSLKDIAKGENKLTHKLPITSNDEIGELEEAFNEFEEEEHSENERLVEQERLSSLGQLVGGIAHNLKSPILSIAGAMEGLSDLINEYVESLDNEQVTKDDYREISKDMREWVEKVREYTSYMSDVITTVKDQAVSSSDGRVLLFTVDEFLKRLDIITMHTLNKNHCLLNKEIHIAPETKIAGDITVLIQVVNNMIMNSVDAYGENRGDINLVIKSEVNTESKKTAIKFIISDNAGGIKPEVAEKLFKQMYTTKGKKGTGLGLYISLTTIKGKFGGDIQMETEYGKGTTFTILIPDRTKNADAVL